MDFKHYHKRPTFLCYHGHDDFTPFPDMIIIIRRYTILKQIPEKNYQIRFPLNRYISGDARVFPREQTLVAPNECSTYKRHQEARTMGCELWRAINRRHHQVKRWQSLGRSEMMPGAKV